MILIKIFLYLKTFCIYYQVVGYNILAKVTKYYIEKYVLRLLIRLLKSTFENFQINIVKFKVKDWS